MRAARMHTLGEPLQVDEVEVPTPGPTDVLVEVKACGICGSDLHFAKHGASMLALGKQMQGMPELGVQDDIDLGRDPADSEMSGQTT